MTAFYFLMYLFPEDMGAVFSEAARVLKSGGRMYIWDAVTTAHSRSRISWS